MKKVAGFSAFLLSSPAREGTRKNYCSQDDRVLFPPHPHPAFGQFLKIVKELWVYLHHILEVIALG